MKKEIDKRLFERSKYKIGDIVVYIEKDRNADGDSVVILRQSPIIEVVGYLESDEPKDSIGWFYHTAETLRTEDDSMEEENILYKVDVGDNVKYPTN